ncbi:MAG: DUF2244 domain-containing protein [Rhizobacter sp.]|nr:DUF2244 domain-containing protein [Rhizobacter sp.]
MPVPRTRWRLARNCSLTPRQTLCAWAPLVGVCLVFAALFHLLGFGWIAVFCLVEVAAVAAALLAYARHARDGDTLVLQGDTLTVEQQHGPATQCTQLQASGVRVAAAHEPDRVLVLCHGGRRIEVGREVSADRRSLAERELRAALRLGELRPTPPREAS